MSSGVIVTDYYTVTAIVRLPDVTLIDVLTPKKHMEFIFTNFLAFFSFYFFWTWAEDYVSTLIFFDPDSFLSGKVIWRTVLPDVDMKWCKCLKKKCHGN